MCTTIAIVIVKDSTLESLLYRLQMLVDVDVSIKAAE